VVVHAKLPRGFLIPTPVGDDNPDSAISFEQGSVKHIYFVAETKGSMSSVNLRDIENAKIDRAKTYKKRTKMAEPSVLEKKGLRESLWVQWRSGCPLNIKHLQYVR